MTGPGAGALHLRGRVLPGGEQRDLWVRGGRCTFTPQPGARTVRDGGWIVPGLVDAHAHLALASPAPPRASAGERVRASARAHLDAGVLLVREPGGPDHASVGLGPSEGLPRVLAAGRFLAPPGGYIPGLAREVGPAELAAAVREEAQASGAWVKLIGDFLDAEGRISPNWAPDDLRTAARAAHAEGARITIHAMHPDTVADALAAGFDALEHGSGVTEEHVAAMRAQGTAWVPTMLIDDLIPGFFEGQASPEGFREVHGWLRTHAAMVGKAAKAGVRVLAGTDAGLGPHGQVASEVALLLAAGLTSEQALAAASWDARAYLGFPGIAEGGPADLVVFEDDPRADPRALRKPALVVLDGRVVGRARAAAP